jgi:hypothetical protein
MYKVEVEFYCHSVGRTLHVGERISETVYANLSDAEKVNLVDEYEEVANVAVAAVTNVDALPDEITVTADEQLLEMNPQLVEKGVKVGDEVTFSGLVDDPSTETDTTPSALAD